MMLPKEGTIAPDFTLTADDVADARKVGDACRSLIGLQIPGLKHARSHEEVNQRGQQSQR